MNFGTVTYQDLERIRHLQPEGWPDILPHFDFYVNSLFCYPIWAEVDGRIVGVGASIHLILGKDIHWQPSAVYSRIGGNLG